MLLHMLLLVQMMVWWRGVVDTAASSKQPMVDLHQCYWYTRHHAQGKKVPTWENTTSYEHSAAILHRMNWELDNNTNAVGRVVFVWNNMP